MKILITGGAGFIGSHIADRYLALGHQVVILDDLSRGHRENVPQGVPFYETSITSPELMTILEKERPDVINHHAGQIDVRKSISEPAEDARKNIIGSLNLFKAGINAGVKKILFASSGGAIYGGNHLPSEESHSPSLSNPYGIGKYTVERYLDFFSAHHKIPAVSLRYANVYGPRQRGDGEGGVVAIFIQKLLRGKEPIIYGDGRQTRDFVFVEDVVRCNLNALEQDVRGVYNVSTGVETSVSALACELIQMAGVDLSPRFVPPRHGERARSCMQPGKLQLSPPMPLKIGIKETFEWFKTKAAVSSV